MKKLYALIFILGLFLGLSQNQAFALTVSPAKLEINGDPGSVLTGVIDVYNEQDRSEVFYTSFENFEPGDDVGTPRFVGADSGLATWLSAQETITLAPGERAEVPFRITIPSDVDPGGYFSALFFGNQPPTTDGGQVSIGGRIGILMLLRVDGDIPEGGDIIFSTTDDQKIHTQLPVDFEYRFSNIGGDRVIPRGDIVVKNMFGGVAATIDANPIEGSVLPSSSRRFNAVWGSGMESGGFFSNVKSQYTQFALGYYVADLNLGWGITNQTDHVRTSVFILPWQLLVVVLILLSVVYFGMGSILRGYKKSLLRQLQDQQKEQTRPDSISETDSVEGEAGNTLS